MLHHQHSMSISTSQQRDTNRLPQVPVRNMPPTQPPQHIQSRLKPVVMLSPVQIKQDRSQKVPIVPFLLQKLPEPPTRI